MFLAFLLDLDKFTLAMLMVDIEATMASLVTLTHRETTFLNMVYVMAEPCRQG